MYTIVVDYNLGTMLHTITIVDKSADKVLTTIKTDMQHIEDEIEKLKEIYEEQGEVEVIW